MRELGSLPSSRAQCAPSSAEVGRDRVGEANGRRDQVGQVAGFEIVQQATRLTHELDDEDALVGRLVRAQLLEALGQLVARPSEVAALEMQQPGGDLDQTLVEVSLVVGSRSPQGLPRLVCVPVANPVEERNAFTKEPLGL